MTLLDLPPGISRAADAGAAPPPAAPASRVHPLPLPRPSRWLDSDLTVLGAVLVTCTLGVWIRHGGAGGLTDGWSTASASLAALTGLLTSLAGLAGLALAGRPRALEQRVGLDRLLVWHRILGETMAVLLGMHVAVSMAAAVPLTGWAGALADLTGRQQYMAGATVGALLVAVVTISSLRSIRRRLSYETWYFVHLAAYLGFALSFGHTIVVGTDFADDAIARWFWIGLHVAAALVLVVGRWGRVARSVFAPLRVIRSEQLNEDTTELVLGGRALGARSADAGQFVMLRPLRRGLWWQAHPFSLSAAPTADGLRVTVKGRGDASEAIRSLPLGARVAVEGPYGACRSDTVLGGPLLFVVGGVGIAPVRALLQRADRESAPVVLYRARRDRDLVHLDELRALAAARGGVVYTLVGPSASLAERDPFGADRLRRIVPDLTDRSAVLCGPESLLAAARSGLRAAGMPSSSIHFERVWW